MESHYTCRSVCIVIIFSTGISSDKTSTAASTPTTVSTPTSANEDSTDEVIRKNRERMMKKMAGKSPKTTSAGFVNIFSYAVFFTCLN